MQKPHKRFNLGICVIRIITDITAFIIATGIFIHFITSEEASSIRLFILFGYVFCVAVVVFDLYFVIRDIRFIRNGNHDRKT